MAACVMLPLLRSQGKKGRGLVQHAWSLQHSSLRVKSQARDRAGSRYVGCSEHCFATSPAARPCAPPSHPAFVSPVPLSPSPRAAAASLRRHRAGNSSLCPAAQAVEGL